MVKVFWAAICWNPAIVLTALLVTGSASAAQENPPATDAERVAAGGAPLTYAPLDRIKKNTQARAVGFASSKAGGESDSSFFLAPASDSTSFLAPIPSVAQLGNPDSSRAIALEALDEGAGEEESSLAEITSVSQLSDVQPTDWAFQALQNLVERYGAIAGYPDGTFRGDRAMTRYEFAAGLNAALDRVSQLLATGQPDLVSREDLAAIQRLSEEFALELATVRSRVSAIDTRTAELEANQFSTTTKLNVTATFNMAVAQAGGDVKVERIDPTDTGSGAGRGADGKPIVTTVKEDPSVTFSELVGLFFTTSFTGKDLLVTTLGVGNGNSPANWYTSAGFFNTYGVSAFDLTPSVNANEVALIEAFYVAPLSSSLQVAVGPRLFWQRYFDVNAFTSSFGRGASAFNTFGSPLVNDLFRGGGAVVLWRVNEQFDLRFGYTNTPDGSNPETGLFNGNRALTAQLTYSPTRNINLRLLYENAKLEPVDGQVTARPIMGVADDGFGGALEDATANTFLVNFDWLVSPRFGVFGRYGYADTRVEPASDRVSGGSIRAQSLQLGLAFPDLGKKGAMATLSYGLPFSVLGGRKFLVSGGGDGGVEYEIEAAYYFPLTDNIAIIPSFFVIGNPNNFDDNPHIYTGTVRTQFSF